MTASEDDRQTVFLEPGDDQPNGIHVTRVAGDTDDIGLLLEDAPFQLNP
jgi:hypothetical protein